MHFRLAANPVHSVKDGEKRGKVTAHTSEKYQLEWLNRQAAKKGFRILPDGAYVVESGWKIFKKANFQQKVRIFEAVYEGTLYVEDVDAFRDTLVSGIGREKAYGMGLLTVVKAEV